MIMIHYQSPRGQHVWQSKRRFDHRLDDYRPSKLPIFLMTKKFSDLRSIIKLFFYHAFNLFPSQLSYKIGKIPSNPIPLVPIKKTS